MPSTKQLAVLSTLLVQSAHAFTFTTPPYTNHANSNSALFAQAQATYYAAAGAPAVGFQFPDTLVAELASLAPREGARIDLYDATGAVIDRYWVEIGALDAAMGFMRLPRMAPQSTAAAQDMTASN